MLSDVKYNFYFLLYIVNYREMQRYWCLFYIYYVLILIIKV